MAYQISSQTLKLDRGGIERHAAATASWGSPPISTRPFVSETSTWRSHETRTTTVRGSTRSRRCHVPTLWCSQHRARIALRGSVSEVMLRCQECQTIFHWVKWIEDAVVAEHSGTVSAAITKGCQS